MRVIILILGILIIYTNANSQKIKKNKDAAIAEITKAGSTVYTMKDAPNNFYYKRYDEKGDATVLYICEGNYVRKVLFICEDPSNVPQRLKESFRTAIDYNFDTPSPGVFTANETCYCDTKARYEGVNNYNEKKFYLEIILLD
jgi:hypothetical protein